MENNESPSEYITPFKFIVDHFEKRQMRTLSVNWERKSLFFHMYEKQVVMGCSFSVSEDDSRLEIHLRYPFFVANEKMRPSVAELVARINFGLRIGSFEFDMKDGEIRYHIGHIMEHYSITEETLRRLFNTGMETGDRYFSAFMQHIYSGVTPEDAVYMAELDLHADRVEENPANEAQPPAPEQKKQTKRRSPKKKAKPDAQTSSPLLLEGSSQQVDNTESPNPQNHSSPNSEERPQDTGDDESRHAA